MRFLKFLISLLTTILLIYLLNNSWLVAGNRLPPLGKFLDPFHGFWKNIEEKDKIGKDKLAITGLKSEVQVIYDSLLIPHIFAANDEDLYLAQGYVTASLRLWQME